MAQQEIPQDQWKSFLDEISRQYEAGLVEVEVRGQPIPQQDALRPMPLIGISYEVKGSGKGRIDVIVGSDTDNNTSHTIAHPVRIRTESTTDGEIDTLLIDAEQGEPVTLIRFVSSI